MVRFKKLLASRLGRVWLAGALVLALSAPALADHFEFAELVGEEAAPTAEDLHVECPEESEGSEGEEGSEGSEGEEGSQEEEGTSECDALVQEAFQELEDYDHPENHGKYVSFVAHCLKGMKGKGRVMRQIAHEKGDGQAELAVKLCAEWKIAQAQDGEESDDEESEEDAELGDKKEKKEKKEKKAKKLKAKKDKDGEEGEEEEVDSDTDSESVVTEVEDDSKKAKSKARKGKGKGRKKN